MSTHFEILKERVLECVLFVVSTDLRGVFKNHKSRKWARRILVYKAVIKIDPNWTMSRFQTKKLQLQHHPSVRDCLVNLNDNTITIIVGEASTRNTAPPGSHSFADGWLAHEAMKKVAYHFGTQSWVPCEVINNILAAKFIEKERPEDKFSV